MSSKPITVIDLHIGNVASVANALKHLGVECAVTDRPADVAGAQRIIFPGVGNYFEAAKRLRAAGLDAVLRQKALEDKTPLLGICLGMQLLSERGEEGGGCEGLGLLKGKAVHHRAGGLGLRLPHVGWNDVAWKDFKLFAGVKPGSCFYFVHSYELVLEEQASVATCNYGADFVAAVQKGNIYGVQFHPEKSQEAGLRVLGNFCAGEC